MPTVRQRIDRTNWMCYNRQAAKEVNVEAFIIFPYLGIVT